MFMQIKRKNDFTRSGRFDFRMVVVIRFRKLKDFKGHSI